MRLFSLLLALTLGACTTPPARYDAFAEVMRGYAGGTTREAQRVQLLSYPPMVETTPAPPPRQRGLRVRPAPPLATYTLPDCSDAAAMTPAGRERCGLAERITLTALANTHANALAAYAASLAQLATRFDPTPAMERLEAGRAEVVAAGTQLEQALGLTADTLEPYRPVPARVGLRPAFAAEMGSNGWQIRQQLALQASALERLETNRAGLADEPVQRLRWAIGHLRSAFEKLIVSDRDALPDIEQARRILAG